MAVLIDPPIWPAHGQLWSHLASDTSYEELHGFAGACGVPRRAFEGDHYDVPRDRYHRLIDAGAVPVPTRQLLRALQASGLRIPKRKGEKVVSSIRDLPGIPVPSRMDLLTSTLPAPAGLAAFVAVLALSGSGRDMRLLLTPDGDGWDLPGGQLEDGEPIGPAAVRQVAEQAGLALHPMSLQLCGHQRLTLLGPRPAGYRFTYPSSWLTYVTATLRHTDVPSAGARWFPVDRARDLVADPLWWPLIAP